MAFFLNQKLKKNLVKLIKRYFIMLHEYLLKQSMYFLLIIIYVLSSVCKTIGPLKNDCSKL